MIGKMPKVSEKNVQGQQTKPQKRKKAFAREPLAKKSKQDEMDDDEYSNRFKYVLAPKTQCQDYSSDEEIPVESPVKRKKPNKKKKIKSEVKENGSKKSNKLVQQIYNEDITDDSDENFLIDMESLSEEESCEEEWSTDTDYSFHESDCESIDSEDNQQNTSYYDFGSTDDEDYKPPIEDKYVKKGDAVMYEAKGLDLAFGDSSESQIIELNDVSAAVLSDEEVPELLPIDGTTTNDPSNDIQMPEETFKNLSITDDTEAVESSQLLERASFYNCTESRGVLVKINRTIHFHGIIIIKPLVNSIQVNGFTLNTHETLQATSVARSDYFLNLTPVINENPKVNRNELLEQLTELLQTKSDAVDIIENFNVEKEVLLHLQQGLPNMRIQMLQTYLSDPILPHKNMILRKSVCPSSELTLATKFFVDAENLRLRSYKINADWDYIQLKSDIKLMVIGGKNVGKSAMTQYLINKNIKKYPKILLIDLDIGQPICGVSQTVSATLITKPLIGTGYLNDTKVTKSFLFGDKSVMVSPFKYNECVARLMDYCHKNEEFKNIPWIINTMGYQKGFGLQLMCILMRIIQPNEVVQIQHSNERYNFRCIVKDSLVNDFSFSFFDESYLKKFPKDVRFVTHVLDSIVNNIQQDEDNNNNDNNNNNNGNKEWTSNATEKRKISILAQLSKLLRGGQTYLNDVIPFGTTIDNIQLIVMNEEYEAAQHDDHHNRNNLDLFNGNLVYLCHNSNNDTVDSDSILECYGLGIVKAIDKVHNYIYIAMPQQDNSEKLQAMIDVLVIGNIPMPSEVLLKQNYGVNGNVPFVTFFKSRNMNNKKYVNKRNIKDCF